MFYHASLMHLAQDRLRELRRAAGSQKLDRARYPDGERQPRITRHWTNRA